MVEEQQALQNLLEAYKAVWSVPVKNIGSRVAPFKITPSGRCNTRCDLKGWIAQHPSLARQGVKVAAVRLRIGRSIATSHAIELRIPADSPVRVVAGAILVFSHLFAIPVGEVRTALGPLLVGVGDDAGTEALEKHKRAVLNCLARLITERGGVEDLRQFRKEVAPPRKAASKKRKGRKASA